MKRLILMMGAAGAGKTTKAREIFNQAPNDSVILSTDDRVTAPVGNIYLFHPDTLGISHQLNQAMARTACEMGVSNVIIDNTNVRASHRKQYEDIANEFDYLVETVEPNTPWKYDIDVLIEKTTHGVPREALHRQLECLKSNTI